MVMPSPLTKAAKGSDVAVLTGVLTVVVGASITKPGVAVVVVSAGGEGTTSGCDEHAEKSHARFSIALTRNRVFLDKGLSFSITDSLHYADYSLTAGLRNSPVPLAHHHP